MRRFSSALIRSVGTGRPAGIPSRTATRPRPCDSPAVVNRKVMNPSGGRGGWWRLSRMVEVVEDGASTNLDQPPQPPRRPAYLTGGAGFGFGIVGSFTM